MSGRAGRRGLDDRGIVILIIDEKMGADVGKGLLKVSLSLLLVLTENIWCTSSNMLIFLRFLSIVQTRESTGKITIAYTARKR